MFGTADIIPPPLQYAPFVQQQPAPSILVQAVQRPAPLIRGTLPAMQLPAAPPPVLYYPPTLDSTKRSLLGPGILALVVLLGGYALYKTLKK